MIKPNARELYHKLIIIWEKSGCSGSPEKGDQKNRHPTAHISSRQRLHATPFRDASLNIPPGNQVPLVQDLDIYVYLKKVPP